MSRIMIVDSLPIIRRALRVLLEHQKHEIVAEADNGLDALQLARERQPELAIVELAIPRLGGLDVIRRLKASHGALKILVYSVQDSHLYAGRCLQVGADAFVSKLDELSELLNALNAVLHGRSYFPREAVHVQDSDAGDSEEASEVGQLSGRELTVLQLLAAGMSNQRIAEQLSISHKTVSTYKMRLQQKLHVESTIQLVEIARRNGVLAWGTGDFGDAGVLSSASAQQLEEYEMLKALVDAAPNPKFVRDLEGRLLMCNRHFLEYHQVEFDEVRERRLDEMPWFSAEVRKDLQRRYEDAIRSGASASCETTMEMHGQMRVFHTWFMPYRDSAGHLRGMIGGLEDLTARDALLAELRNARAQAEATSQVKSQVLAAVGRELQPLVRMLDSLLNQTLSQVSAGSPEAALLLSAGEVLGGMQDALGTVIKLNRLEAQQPAAVAEAHRLDELTSVLVEPMRSRIRDLGGELSLDISGIARNEVWIDAAHYGQLLEAWLAIASPRTSMARLQLTVRSFVLPRGFVGLSLLLGLPDGDAADTLALMSRVTGNNAHSLESAHLHGLLKLLGARMTVEETEPHGPALCIEMTLLPADVQH